MKKFLALLSALLILFSCEEGNKDDIDDGAVVYDIVGEYQMNYGPHAMAVKGNFVFAGRDDIISVVDLSDVTNPELAITINDVESSNDFEALLVDGNYLYAACASEYAIYVYDITDPDNPVKISKFNDEVSSGNPIKGLSIFKDNNTLWVGGSNDLNGLITKLDVTNKTAISIEDYFILSGSGNAGGGIWANSTHAFLSTADGKVLSFDASDLSSGIIDEYTFSNEAGHEHWGKTLVGDGSKLYWADWGAGLATIDISDPTNMSTSSIITHSTYKAEHTDAEGTDVYDIVLDKTDNKLFVANGWSGLLSIDLTNSSSVDEYVDYKENLYYCIELYGNYVLLGDVSTGITNKSGIKIIKVK